MKIAVDLDNVVFDFCGEFLKFSNIRFNHNDTMNNIDRWEFWESPNMAITGKEFSQGFKEFTENRCWHEIPIYEDAKYVLCSLSSMGHSIYYMTDRPKEARRATLKALLGNGLPIDSVLFLNYKEKADIAKQLGIDIAIDDKPETIELYRDRGIIPTIRKTNHNKKYIADNKYEHSPSSPVYVCENMAHFLKTVKIVEGKRNLDSLYASVKKT